MNSTLKKRLFGTLVLVAVAGLSYAAGAAKGKAPVNMSSTELVWEPFAPGVPLQVAKLWGDRTRHAVFSAAARQYAARPDLDPARVTEVFLKVMQSLQHAD